MKKISLLFLSIFFLTPFSLFAAKFTIDAPTEVSNGEETLLKVMVDTGTDKINAISGTVPIDSNAFVVSKIYDGDSAILLWIERPTINTTKSSVSFSGLTPGGFQGSKVLFSIVVKSKTPGTFVFGLKDIIALKNDGKGTQIKTDIKPVSILVHKNVSTSTINIEDTTSPESFIPVLDMSPDVFNNELFVSFAAVDKGVGIDHYEYASKWLGSPSDKDWVTVESPFLIPKGDQSKLIFIKAIDRNGNERISSTARTTYYELVVLWVILILLFLCVLLFLTRRLRHLRS